MSHHLNEHKQQKDSQKNINQLYSNHNILRW